MKNGIYKILYIKIFNKNIINNTYFIYNFSNYKEENSTFQINTMYYIQRKGDNDNILYDTLTKNNVSSYKRYDGNMNAKEIFQ